ncbi:hypothetical protein KSX26_22905, partial [Acinetobacter baumannii]|nr:hypothetical protein [Acinetobacter baumannii]
PGRGLTATNPSDGLELIQLFKKSWQPYFGSPVAFSFFCFFYFCCQSCPEYLEPAHSYCPVTVQQKHMQEDM